MELGGVPGWDDAAHAYKVFLLRDGDSIFWDTYWYGGGYGAITYGFVFYWLAQYVSGALIVILAAGTDPGVASTSTCATCGRSTTCGRPGASRSS